MSSKPSYDAEKAEPNASSAHLINTTVRSFSWRDVSVTVKDRESKLPRDIVHNAHGIVKAGELVALMGPSGSGKTTLLNVLSRRTELLRGSITGDVFVNGQKIPLTYFRQISSFVEQEDALIGSLTVHETLDFAARLALPKTVSKHERMARIENLIMSFGLHDQSGTLIGTPIRKGISGGQKRRVSVAAQLITSPRILFLDEPTSGLDSAASFEVINFVRAIAKQFSIIVIASIHQPSSTTFNLFDRLVLLSQGRQVYNGAVTAIPTYFERLGHFIPTHMNPAEFLLDLVNTDFNMHDHSPAGKLNQIQDSWQRSEEAATIDQSIQEAVGSSSRSNGQEHEDNAQSASAGMAAILVALIHRSFIKSYRDVVAYGIRIVMYLGLAIMMGTVWLRLSPDQEHIQPYINAIFFGGAFMSFMAVAYIPSFLEDRAMYVKERSNGLYGPTAFIISNFATGLPYLLLITILFSVVSYWLSNFQPTASAFGFWVLYLFLDLLAAESLVVLISSAMPIFVVALAATAFVNGLWMSVGGFLVPLNILNPFWKYAFSYIDYQRWVFEGMMANEFQSRTYACAQTPTGCQCMYQTDLADRCLIDGRGVLASYGYQTGKNGRNVGIILAIVLAYRVLAWMALYFKRR